MEESDDRDEGIIVNIHKCLDGKATSADVGRLWKQAAELEKVNWNQPETLSLKALLVSCFEARVFYKSAQGINFLALVFNLHPLMLAPILDVLKGCILNFPHQAVLECGKVLFKAWTSSTGGMRLLIEQCIMDWMRKALFTSTKTAERVRFLLSELHSTARTKEIDDLLSRYYGPILFRHTKVANWEVRFNAVALVCAAFPVMPPDRSAIEFEEKLTVQFRILKDAMEDPNESVRKVAIVGTGRILRDFWEVLTIEQIAMVLDTLVERCGRDKQSVKTRQAVIESVSLIVDNPLSHGVMASGILPAACPLLFNDEAPMVRLRLCELLTKLAKFRTISIPAIVNQANIFSRLATDHALGLHATSTNVLHKQIALLLSNLVAPSLFTSAVDDQVSRSERMAESLPQGFLALVANCSSAVPEIDRVRLAVALMSRAVSLLGKAGTESPHKLGTARVLLRAVAELFRSAKWAGAQGTEDLFKKDSDEQKLCAFVYRHIVDREILKVVEAQDVALGELLDALSSLDGNRLPMTYCKIETWLEQGTSKASLTRVASAWGIYGAAGTKAHWTRILDVCKFQVPQAGTAAAADAVAAMLEVSLKLGDSKTIRKNKEEIVLFVQSISTVFPNVKFLPRASELIQLALACLLRGCAGEEASSGELVSVLHRVNIGLFAALTTAPLPPMRIAKKLKKSSDTPAPDELVEVAMTPQEMTDFMHFYLAFLIVASLVSGIPLKACKFDELVKRCWCWIDRDTKIIHQPQLWETQLSILQSCIDSEQGPATCLGLVESALSRVTAQIPSDEALAKLLRKTVEEFVFTNEFATLTTKFSLTKEQNPRVINAMTSLLKDQDSVPQSIGNVIGIDAPMTESLVA